MRQYTARVEFSNGEYHDIDIVVVPITNHVDYEEQYWVIFPTELHGLVTELYDPFYTLTGFIKCMLLAEYQDVISIEANY